jgi:tetratricopeptide (TPR) repeat protein
MSIRVASNRFIISSLQKRVGFYQEILRSFSGFQSIGQKLIAQAETAQDFRQVDKLEELSIILCNLPISEYQYIGQYYLAWCHYRRGESTSHIFEGVVEKSQTYKVKGLISLGALETAKGDYATSLKHYAEAIRWADNPSMFVSAAKGVAILRSIEGDHKQALKSLQGLAPIARYANAKVYNDYLNSFAVELLEAGRMKEAQNISNIVLASPYAFAYPEWRETGNEIDLRAYKSRWS